MSGCVWFGGAWFVDLPHDGSDIRGFRLCFAKKRAGRLGWRGSLVQEGGAVVKFRARTPCYRRETHRAVDSPVMSVHQEHRRGKGRMQQKEAKTDRGINWLAVVVGGPLVRGVWDGLGGLAMEQRSASSCSIRVFASFASTHGFCFGGRYIFAWTGARDVGAFDVS